MRAANLIDIPAGGQRRSMHLSSRAARPVLASVAAALWLGTTLYEIGLLRQAITQQHEELSRIRQMDRRVPEPDPTAPVLRDAMLSIQKYRSGDHVEHAITDVLVSSGTHSNYESLMFQRQQTGASSLATLGDALGSTYTVQVRGTSRDSMELARLAGRFADSGGLSNVHTETFSGSPDRPNAPVPFLARAEYAPLKSRDRAGAQP